MNVLKPRVHIFLWSQSLGVVVVMSCPFQRHQGEYLVRAGPVIRQRVMTRLSCVQFMLLSQSCMFGCEGLHII